LLPIEPAGADAPWKQAEATALDLRPQLLLQQEVLMIWTNLSEDVAHGFQGVHFLVAELVAVFDWESADEWGFVDWIDTDYYSVDVPRRDDDDGAAADVVAYRFGYAHHFGGSHRRMKNRPDVADVVEEGMAGQVWKY
jgi:hypothetical protein